MAAGRGRPTAPTAGGPGPRIAACALIAGIGVLVALVLTPGVGNRAARGDDSVPSATSTNTGKGGRGIEDKLPEKDSTDRLADVKTVRLTVNGTSRKTLLYVPPDVKSPAPAFVAVHGYTGSAAALVRHTSLVDLAERNGWIVAFPQGLRYANGQNAWNAGTCCGGAPNAGTADVRFLTLLAKKLADDYGADPQRTFYQGYSNGAMLGYRIACQPNQPFRGFALLSGTEVNPCHTTSDVPLLAIHGLGDTTVPFHGSRWRVGLQTKLLPVPDAISSIASFNGCQGRLAEHATRDARIKVYSSQCPKGAKVDLVTVANMTHQWTEEKATYGIDETRYSTDWLLNNATR